MSKPLVPPVGCGITLLARLLQGLAFAVFAAIVADSLYAVVTHIGGTKYSPPFGVDILFGGTVYLASMLVIFSVLAWHSKPKRAKDITYLRSSRRNP